MIQLVDGALEEFLRDRVPLAAHAVDVSFQAPDKSWGSALTRPTVNVFLWDVTSHSGYLKTGIQQRVGPAGAVERRPTNPVVDLSYMVTSWATERRDEHELLGSVLSVFSRTVRSADEFLPERFQGARCGLSLAPADGRVPGDFWSALDGRLKAGLQLQVTLPVEVFAWQPTATPAEQVDLTVAPRPAPAAKSAEQIESRIPPEYRRTNLGRPDLGRPEPRCPGQGGAGLGGPGRRRRRSGGRDDAPAEERGDRDGGSAAPETGTRPGALNANRALRSRALPSHLTRATASLSPSR